GTAVYTGDANFAGSTSAASQQVVNPTATMASLTSTPSVSTINQPVTYTAVVTPLTGTGTPTGIVTFLSDGVSFGTAPLRNGTASLTSSGLAAGTHVLTATYGGDDTVPARTSPAHAPQGTPPT